MRSIYHLPKADIISKIYHPFCRERISLKKPSLRMVFSWLREKGSNPHKQSQSLPCYHYTIPQYFLLFFAALLLYSFFAVCQALLQKFQKSLQSTADFRRPLHKNIGSRDKTPRTLPDSIDFWYKKCYNKIYSSKAACFGVFRSA